MTNKIATYTPCITKRVNIKISRTLCPIFYSHSSSSISINGQCNFFKFSFCTAATNSSTVGCIRDLKHSNSRIFGLFCVYEKTWMEVLNFTFHLCCVCFHYLQTFFILFSQCWPSSQHRKIPSQLVSTRRAGKKRLNCSHRKYKVKLRQLSPWKHRFSYTSA